MDMDLDLDWEVIHPVAEAGMQDEDDGESHPTAQPTDQPSSSSKKSDKRSKKKQNASSAAGETTPRTSKKAKKGKEARRRSSHAINLDKQCAVPLPPRRPSVPAPASGSGSGPGPGPKPDENNNNSNSMMDVSTGDADSTSTVKRCTRALTCKSHSFGAKRAVAGRSAPFDILLKALVERRRVRAMENNTVPT
jgi:SAGA-associated factor 73